MSAGVCIAVLTASFFMLVVATVLFKFAADWRRETLRDLKRAHDLMDEAKATSLEAQRLLRSARW